MGSASAASALTSAAARLTLGRAAGLRPDGRGRPEVPRGSSPTETHVNRRCRKSLNTAQRGRRPICVSSRLARKESAPNERGSARNASTNRIRKPLSNGVAEGENSQRPTLLLPLAIVDDEVVDIALVVTRNPSGSYQGRTVLPLDWAYQNARLVCRPDSDWLVPAFIKDVDTVSEPDEEEAASGAVTVP
ncbi:MAG: DUF3825 domain-containing protein [Acidobacteria bacterium]|nr:DUF3825 domain-containing protein [Acidobacteriota bacterium]